MEEKEDLIETLVDKIHESMSAAVAAIESIGEDRRSNITHFINAEYNIGKYHAYMNVMEDLNIETFVMCHEKYKEDWHKVMQGMEKLYQMVERQ